MFEDLTQERLEEIERRLAELGAAGLEDTDEYAELHIEWWELV